MTVATQSRTNHSHASNAPIDYSDSILDLVGNTPLVRLSRVTRDLGPIDRQPLVLAKLEMLNPGGSVKDRIGLPMIEAAEHAGLLKPGGTIIEPTSGNTGHGLAIAAALKGYRCVFVMADKQSSEKQALLRAYGAEVVVCPTAVPPESPESYYSVAARLARDIPGAFSPGQYWNQENPAAHERTTGPEIWRQTGGRITHFVAGAGTGGTITGVGEVLKERKPQTKIVAVEPAVSSVITQHRNGQPLRPGKHSIQGIGAGFIPDILNINVIDEVIAVADEDAIETSQQLARLEGFMCGVSSGAACWAAIQVANRPENRGKLVVVILPDLGERYLSTKLFPE